MRALLAGGGSEASLHLPGGLLLIFLGLAGMHAMEGKYRMTQRVESLAPLQFAAVMGIAWAFAIALVPLSASPFVYFQF